MIKIEVVSLLKTLTELSASDYPSSGQKPKGKASDGGKGSEDEDDDGGADDAEMFRMDAKMAAYLRGMVDARKGAKERRVALANLRLRALSLIETFAKKVKA